MNYFKPLLQVHVLEDVHAPLLQLAEQTAAVAIINTEATKLILKRVWHVVPDHCPMIHEHVLGAEQVPPFKQGDVQMAAKCMGMIHDPILVNYYARVWQMLPV